MFGKKLSVALICGFSITSAFAYNIHVTTVHTPVNVPTYLGIRLILGVPDSTGEICIGTRVALESNPHIHGGDFTTIIDGKDLYKLAGPNLGCIQEQYALPGLPSKSVVYRVMDSNGEYVKASPSEQEISFLN